ncbi:MAG: hypothetical protein Q9195_007335 [Heterodermia aff. obscurata]
MELRHQIYEMCFAECVPEPGLLGANKAIRYDSMRYLAKYQQTFTINIDAWDTKFDRFSRWCFRIKRHTPKFNRIKHLIVNISPPDPGSFDRGALHMWNIWCGLSNLCGGLQRYRRIPQLTIRFLEGGKIKWANDTLRLGCFFRQFCYEDIGQLLLLITRRVKNVNKPTLILPESYFRTWLSRDIAEASMTGIEELMTGYWKDEDYDDQYCRYLYLIQRTRYWEQYGRHTDRIEPRFV